MKVMDANSVSTPRAYISRETTATTRARSSVLRISMAATRTPLDGQLTLGTGQIDPCRFLAFEVQLLDELGLRFSGVLQHGSHLLCC